MNNNQSHHRTIRSFVKREGRLTKAQLRALEELYPIYGIELTENAIIDVTKIFPHPDKIIFEIGFGMGDSLVEMAKAQPEHNFIGIDVHRPGLGTILQKIKHNDLHNLRIIEGDAVEILKHNIDDHCLDVIQIFFPDPWPKKRHHKRRLIQTEFVRLLLEKLKPNGLIHLATDWQNYAEQMLEVLSNIPELENLAGKNNFSPRPAWRPLTKFEQRGETLGHNVWDLLFGVKSSHITQ